MRVLDLYGWVGERFGPAKEEQNGSYVTTACPLKCHRTATVRWWVYGDNNALCFKCWASCPKLEILRAVGASWKDCFQPGQDLARIKQEIVARYRYLDESGLLLYETLRLEPGLRGRDKDFRQRRPDPSVTEGKKKWIYNLDGVRRVLYNLGDIITSRTRGREVYVCAGEKDCESLRDVGLIATTNVCGERSEWTDEYSYMLAGRDVIVVQDRDSAGLRHANEVCGSLMEHAASVRRVRLPDKDSTAFLNRLRCAGKTRWQDLQHEYMAAVASGLLWERVEVLNG